GRPANRPSSLSSPTKFAFGKPIEYEIGSHPNPAACSPTSHRYSLPSTLSMISRSSSGRYVRRQDTNPSNTSTNGITGTTYVHSSRDHRNGRIHGVLTNKKTIQRNIAPIAAGARLVVSNIPMPCL